MGALLSVSNGMNPPAHKSLDNLATYFKINEALIVKKNVQEQVNKFSVYTGEYFNVELDSETFFDMNYGSLTYSIESAKDADEHPTWLSLRGLSLMGTAPEQWRHLQYHLVLVASNEFKSTRIPFTLNMKFLSFTL